MKNTNKIIAASMGVVVCLAGIWYAIRGRQEQRGLQGARVDSSWIRPASSGEVELGAAIDGSVPTQAGLSQRTAVDLPGEEALPTVATRLHGTIVVFGGGQRIGASLEHANEDGTLTLEVLDGATPGKVEVAVVGGAWSIESGPDVRYQVVEATLGARLTRVDDAPALTASDAPIALTARWVTDILLHVVDAEIGIELEGVDVLVQESWEARWDHPTAASLEDALITGASSPVLIEVNSGRYRVRVRAPGYSWTDIELDLDQGPERTVTLSRAGSLVVLADVDGIELPVQVRIYPGGWDSSDPAYVALDLVPGQPTLFENLAAGDHQVRVEFGSWLDPPTILAQREVTLAPGERRTVRLATDIERVVPRRAALAGSLELPPGASDLPVELQICPPSGPGWRQRDKQRIPLGRMQATGSGRTYRWDAGEVSSGRLKLIVHPLQISVVVEVPPTGNQAVHLVVPELAQVQLSVVDKSNTRPMPVDMYVAWSKFEVAHPRRLPARPGSRSERRVDPEHVQASHPGRASFVAPVGRTLITVGYPGYEREGRWVELVPGQNDVDFMLTPLPTLLLGFLDGADLVPAPLGLSVRALGDGEEWHLSGPLGGRLLGTMEEPGRYLVCASPEAKYVFSPREVRIRAGERTELDIAVQRNH